MNAVVYVRVSTDEQVDNYSLATQQQACEDYCLRRGFRVVQVFREEGASAKTTNRPQLRAMLEYCIANSDMVDAVLVHRTDRLARRLEDHLSIKASLTKLGIQLVSVQEEFDDTASGRLIENVIASIAQFDNDLRSARTLDAMRAGLADGRWMWGAPIGYRRSPTKTGPSLVPDPATGPLVRLAFELYAEGDLTKRETWRRVSDLGLHKGGKQLSIQSFGEMLKNPIYRGRIVSEKLGFEGPGDFEPLVTDEIWHRAQNVSVRRKMRKTQRQWDHPDFPLRRVVHCGSCDAPLTASWTKGRSKKYPYYRCPRKSCRSVNLRAEAMERQFLQFLRSLEIRPELLSLTVAVVRDAWRNRVRAASGSRQLIRKRLAEVEAQRQKLLRAFLYENLIDRNTYDTENERLEDSKQALSTQLGEISALPDDVEVPLEIASALLADLTGFWNQLEPLEKPRFLRAMFPGGLWFGGDSIGTMETPWLLWPSRRFGTAEEALVAPTVEDWNRFEDWLKRVQQLPSHVLLRSQRPEIPGQDDFEGSPGLPPLVIGTPDEGRTK